MSSAQEYVRYLLCMLCQDTLYDCDLEEKAGQRRNKGEQEGSSHSTLVVHSHAQASSAGLDYRHSANLTHHLASTIIILKFRFPCSCFFRPFARLVCIALHRFCISHYWPQFGLRFNNSRRTYWTPLYFVGCTARCLVSPQTCAAEPARYNILYLHLNCITGAFLPGWEEESWPSHSSAFFSCIWAVQTPGRPNSRIWIQPFRWLVRPCIPRLSTTCLSSL
ncbi:hypothetical protein F5Y17DRAFT_95076 [Xylariaceae sp. FL0594]|nr:hypothetical protein F5Y17DRAFT_95076 [Xylariaceae sp. FL0594]